MEKKEKHVKCIEGFQFIAEVTVTVVEGDYQRQAVAYKYASYVDNTELVVLPEKRRDNWKRAIAVMHCGDPRGETQRNSMIDQPLSEDQDPGQLIKSNVCSPFSLNGYVERTCPHTDPEHRASATGNAAETEAAMTACRELLGDSLYYGCDSILNPGFTVEDGTLLIDEGPTT